MSKTFADLLVETGTFKKSVINEALEQQKEEGSSISNILVAAGYITRSGLREIFHKYRHDMYFGELLLESGVVTDAKAIDEALEYKKTHRVMLGEALVDLEHLTQDQLVRGLCQQTNTMIIMPEPELAHDVRPTPPQKFLEDNLVIPYYQEEGLITIVMADPFDDRLVNRIAQYYNGQELEFAYGEKDNILAFFSQKRAWADQRGRAAQKEEPLFAVGALDGASSEVEGNEAVKVFQIYLRKGIDMGASDIHFEPLANVMRIRFALDGMLETITTIPNSLTRNIISMIKTASGLDISKRFTPGDGRLTASHNGRPYDLRISTYPCLHGENVVIRILKRDQSLEKLDDMGFSPANLEKLRFNLKNPSGVTIVTGPTGSGKTTLLYTALMEAAASAKQHIITIEDPVEFTLDGITQGTVKEAMGFDYESAISSIMRQNPDIIMVGEIRDKKAAYAVIQAALTGHKVLTTFHTEHSTGALARLIDMGVENFLISETVVFVVSQRLVRRICLECAAPYQPDPAIVRALEIDDFNADDYTFQMGTGKVLGSRCENCSGTGYKGRVAIHEVLQVTDEVSKAILDHKKAWEIREIAKNKGGMVSLKEDGIYKVLKGITTFEDVFRIIPHVYENARPIPEIIRLSDETTIKRPDRTRTAPKEAQPVNVNVTVSADDIAAAQQKAVEKAAQAAVAAAAQQQHAPIATPPMATPPAVTATPASAPPVATVTPASAPPVATVTPAAAPQLEMPPPVVAPTPDYQQHEVRAPSIDEKPTESLGRHPAYPSDKPEELKKYETGKLPTWEDSLDDETITGKTLVRRYRILEKLGQGGMGAVYKATQISTGKDVAIKVINRELTKEADTVQRFQREVAIQAKMEHPNIITVVDFDRTPDGYYFFVMQYVAGQSLSDLVKDKMQLTTEEFSQVAMQILDGIEYAHRKNIIHRDIKGDNIIIAEMEHQQIVKILDFGLAKAAHQDTMGLTDAGHILGTPSYMSPEQAQGESGAIGPESDIYSIGVLFYQMLTGSLPFVSDTPWGLIQKHISATPKPLRERTSGISEKLEAVVLKCLEKDPLNRFHSALALKAAIDEAIFGRSASQKTHLLKSMPDETPDEDDEGDNIEITKPNEGEQASEDSEITERFTEVEKTVVEMPTEMAPEIEKTLVDAPIESEYAEEEVEVEGTGAEMPTEKAPIIEKTLVDAPIESEYAEEVVEIEETVAEIPTEMRPEIEETLVDAPIESEYTQEEEGTVAEMPLEETYDEERTVAEMPLEDVSKGLTHETQKVDRPLIDRPTGGKLRLKRVFHISMSKGDVVNGTDRFQAALKVYLANAVENASQAPTRKLSKFYRQSRNRVLSISEDQENDDSLELAIFTNVGIAILMARVVVSENSIIDGWKLVVHFYRQEGAVRNEEHVSDEDEIEAEFSRTGSAMMTPFMLDEGKVDGFVIDDDDEEDEEEESLAVVEDDAEDEEEESLHVVEDDEEDEEEESLLVVEDDDEDEEEESLLVVENDDEDEEEESLLVVEDDEEDEEEESLVVVEDDEEDEEEESLLVVEDDEEDEEEESLLVVEDDDEEEDEDNLVVVDDDDEDEGEESLVVVEDDEEDEGEESLVVVDDDDEDEDEESLVVVDDDDEDEGEESLVVVEDDDEDEDEESLVVVEDDEEEDEEEIDADDGLMIIQKPEAFSDTHEDDDDLDQDEADIDDDDLDEEDEGYDPDSTGEYVREEGYDPDSTIGDIESTTVYDPEDSSQDSPSVRLTEIYSITLKSDDVDVGSPKLEELLTAYFVHAGISEETHSAADVDEVRGQIIIHVTDSFENEEDDSTLEVAIYASDTSVVLMSRIAGDDTSSAGGWKKIIHHMR